ncbi:MAG TPA: hypothetical protein VFC12_05950 [Terriglobales bacterium]|nr:hypothetical protein [Terriglobales bacterium]
MAYEFRTVTLDWSVRPMVFRPDRHGVTNSAAKVDRLMEELRYLTEAGWEFYPDFETAVQWDMVKNYPGVVRQFLGSANVQQMRYEGVTVRLRRRKPAASAVVERQAPARPPQSSTAFDAQERASERGTKACPDCAEMIKEAARICRFCRHEFWAEGETAPTTRPDDPTGLMDDSAGQSEAVPEAVKILVWQRDKGKCVLCGDYRNLVFGRLVPASRGGASTPANLKLVCEPCSRRLNGPAA